MNLYRCGECDHQVESEKTVKRCPKCKKNAMFEAIFYKMDNGKLVRYKPEEEGPYVCVRLGDSEVKSIDHLGRRNFERDEKLGIINENEGRKADQEKEDFKKNPTIGKHKRMKTKKEKPWWRDSKRVDTSIADLSPKKLDEYIMKGTK